MSESLAGSGGQVVVVGGGISGLVAAYRIRRLAPRVRVTVLEAGPRVGGTATTDVVGDCTVERGPNGLLIGGNAIGALVDELGLSSEVVMADARARVRYVVRGGGFVEAPSSPPGLLRSPLLTLGGRLRLLAEPLVPRGGDREETVWSFVARRFGPEVADNLVAPALVGVTGGDARRTELASLFPLLAELESRWGSVLGGLVARRLRTGESPPRPRLGTFREGGLARLMQRLASEPGVEVLCDATVEAVRRDGVWTLTLADGRTVAADGVVLACPAWASSELLADVDQRLADDLAAIPYAGLAVVTLGYERPRLRRDTDGFGFIVRRGEGVRMLGCQWTHAIFPEQVSDGTVIFRALYGGTFDPEFFELDRASMLRTARLELSRLLGVEEVPWLQHVTSWPVAIPQYVVGHTERVQRIDAAAARLPALALAGNALHGVGFNDCIVNADRAARQVVAGLRAGVTSSELGPA